MRLIWTTLALSLIFFNGKALVESVSTNICYSFNTTDEGWTYESGFYWKWSGSSLPDAINIPSFLPTSNYLWFQDQDTPPVSGAYRAPGSVTLEYGATVQSNIFRNILVGHANDTDRPVLRIVTGSTVQNVLYSVDYDWWSPVSVTCTNTNDWTTKEAQCCLTYPCTGYFRVEGQVLIRDELLGIDEIGINNACYSPAPPPPPPTPSNWCCNFATIDVCDWSPKHVTTGWIWSGTTPDPEIEVFTSDEYIYIHDTSASAISPNLTLVPDTSTFSISYYFASATIDTYNRLEASFKSDAGTAHVLSSSLSLTGSTFVDVTLSLSGLCEARSTCTGQFYLTTYNAPAVEQTAALQHFSVNGETC